MAFKYFIIAYHGAIVRDRGLEEMIKLLSMNNDVCAVVLGNGNNGYIDSLKQLACELGVNARVYFHPAVLQGKIWEYVGAVDVSMALIQPVVKSYYLSLPNKLFESIQSLTPVIASDIPEMRKIVDQYKIGKTCNPVDVEGINRVIMEMMKDRESYSRYKENLLLAKEELCWENEQKVLEKALREKVGGTSSITAIKLVMNDFLNASRDRREVDVMRKLGWDVTVMYPYNDKNGPCDNKYKYINLKKIRLNEKQNKFLRKFLIIWNEIRYLFQIRHLRADVISCHDITALRVAWLAFLGKKRPKLIYDSHEFELGRHTGRKRGCFVTALISFEEKFLMKRCVFTMMVNESIAEEVQRIHKLRNKPLVIRNVPYKYRIDIKICEAIREEFNNYFDGKV